jgi:threonine/homoserine/homoserine lactone efflux protein
MQGLSLDFIALFTFAAATLFTPGPNNMMLTASGANFGLARTLPHMVGINLGFPSMLLICGLGLAQLLQVYPAIFEVLKWIGAAFLLYLAVRIATASGMKKTESGEPLSLWEAFFFQYVNPKAWSMAFGATSAFVPSPEAAYLAAPLIAVTFMVLGYGSALTWTLFGQAIGRLLTTGERLVWFNRAMGALLAASIALILL